MSETQPEKMDSVEPDTTSSTKSSKWMPSWGSLMGVMFCGLIFLKLSGPLQDNSLLTHIATGRFILENGFVPSEDIYTYTAEGTPWVVQSWLVSSIYASLESWFGPPGIRIFVGLVGVALFVVLWIASRPLNLLIRATTVGILAISGTLFFSHRPTTFGLLFVVMTAVISRGMFHPIILVPVGMIWANMHGSWPIGLALAGILVFAAILDKENWKGAPLKAFVFLSAGILIGALGPLGTKALTFPLSMFQRQDVLGYIVEWRRPEIFSLATIFIWVLLILAVSGWFRNKTWKSGLVIIFAVALSLSARRNIPVSSFLLFFPIVDGWQHAGKVILNKKSLLPALLIPILALPIFILGVSSPDWNFDKYPTRTTDQMEQRGWMKNPDVLIVSNIVAGNYWSLRYGPDHKIFYDDRFDMYDKALIERMIAIDSREKSHQEQRDALESFAPDIVVWGEEDTRLPTALGESENWKKIKSYDDEWVVFCRLSSLSVPCDSFPSP